MSVQWDGDEEPRFSYDWHQSQLRKQKRARIWVSIMQLLGMLTLLVLFVLVASEEKK